MDATTDGVVNRIVSQICSSPPGDSRLQAVTSEILEKLWPHIYSLIARAFRDAGFPIDIRDPSAPDVPLALQCLYDALLTYDPQKASFTTYLYNIARRIACEYTDRKTVSLDEGWGEDRGTVDIVAIVEARAETRALWKVVKELPADMAEILLAIAASRITPDDRGEFPPLAANALAAARTLMRLNGW